MSPWSDLLACHRLGAVVSRGPFHFEFGWGCAIASWAAAADVALVGRVDWSREKLERCLNELEAIRPFPSAADNFEAAGKRLAFDGDWRKQQLSEQDYQKAFAAADARYVQLLTALLAELK